MSGDVTITGGSNNGDTGSPAGYNLGFNVADTAYNQATALTSALNITYGNSTTQLAQTAGTPGGLVISPDQDSTFEALSGFAAIAIQDTANPQTVVGGGIANQTVVGGAGDLTFFAQNGGGEDHTNIKLAAIGGDNAISFAGNDGQDYVWTSNGNDTVIGGDTLTSIQLGAGNNSVEAHGGLTSIQVDGQDTLSLGSGQALVYVDPAAPGASELIHGIGHTTVNGYSLTFINGAAASTVTGGAGSYYILAGAGGGTYTGGAGGNNQLLGGSGNVKLTGGGNNDFLSGGSGNDTIRAGNGGTVWINAGTGATSILAGSGNDYINAQGADTIHLGSGYSYINASSGNPTVSALIQGATTVTTGTSPSLTFVGSASASTILGGAGSYQIDGGAGGGVFHGGSAGGNYIHGTGAMTIFGSGSNDVLMGGDTGNNLIVAGSGLTGTDILGAGAGNATLVGNTQKDDFSFANIGTLAGAYTVQGFHTGDLTHFADDTTAAYALSHYDVSSGTNGTITLQHGATIVLQGYTGVLGTQTGYANYQGGLKTDLVT